MLRGAVKFGEDFEHNYMKKIFILEKGMTQAITHYSQHEDADVTTREGKYHYTGGDKKNALTKIRRFYRISIGTLCIVAALLFVITNFEAISRQKVLLNFISGEKSKAHPGDQKLPTNSVIPEKTQPSEQKAPSNSINGEKAK
jgi:hypothetical protein